MHHSDKAIYVYIGNQSVNSIDYLGFMNTAILGALEGVASGAITIEEAIKIAGSIAALIAAAKLKGYKVSCKSCKPSVGTKMEQIHTTHSHNKMCPHYHVFTVMQSPPMAGCVCFAPKQEAYPTSQGYMSYVYPTGGGIKIVK